MTEPIISKTCSKCKEVKEVSEFYTNKRAISGLTYACKACIKARVNARQNTAHGQASAHAYYMAHKHDPEFIAKRQKRQKKYKKSPRGIAAEIRYHTSTKFKEAMRAKQKTPQYKEYQRRSRRNMTKEQRRAHRVLNKAVAYGLLPNIKTLICTCGDTAYAYHHWHGYTEEHIFDVISVCQLCHMNIHYR